MSWNVEIKPATLDKVFEAVNSAVLQGGDSPEHREQFAAAKQAILGVVASGALGDGTDGRVYRFYLNGHANPGHMPLAGWSDDFMSITLRSDPPKPAE